MSGRALRKPRPRAAAKALNYDEANFDDSEEELSQPSRKRPTRVSTRLTESTTSQAKDADPVEVGSTSDASDSPAGEMDIDPEPNLGTQASASVSGAATPSDDPASDLPGPSKPSARKVRLRLSKTKLPSTPAEDEPEVEQPQEQEDETGEVDAVEDEDEVDPESEESDADVSQSASASAAGGSARPSVPMTARQAAMAGVSASDVQLLSLDQIEASRKKAPTKTAEELEDKRREAAKRRKLQLEQKVKEEKEGAVDRLLNKQAPRPRAKRNMSGAGAIGTPTGYATPVKSGLRHAEVAGDGVDTRSTSPDGDGSGSTDSGIPYVPPATTIRWVSTSRGLPLVTEITSAKMEVDGHAAGEVVTVGQEDSRALSFTLSIPSDILAQLRPSPDPAPPQSRPLLACGVSGCVAPRKYRVVIGGGEKGACGLDHFRLLKGVAT